ncbi:MAG: tRNA pseudouridine(55) synthase TruB [Oscillospiraceae bacterium]|nr:tRNA pseudouridine(55) synthase TruB [Oscillospiraceae bacterium]
MNINGALNLNKPGGKTSHDMVCFARRLFSVKKAGHAGTLDPMATGVLPVLIGSATKLSDLLSGNGKEYRAVLRLGMTADTMDVTGNITGGYSLPLPDFEEVKEVAGSFTGEILQIPPVYSAIKLKGRKLYEYAREGIEITPEPRRVNIYSLTCEETDNPGDYILNIECSKGTYIRSLCHDIGVRLKCGGVMAGLERTRAGSFDIKESFTPEILEKYKTERGEEGLASLIIPCEDILKNITSKKIILDGFYSRLAKNGAEIYLRKLKLNAGDFEPGDKILTYDYNNILFALGEIRDYPDGRACKPVIFAR